MILYSEIKYLKNEKMLMESIKETEVFLFILKLLKKAFKFLNADFAIMAFLPLFLYKFKP